MPTYPYNPVSETLLSFPEMIIVYLVALSWVVLFAVHMVKPDVRYWSGKTLISLCILLGILAPLKFVYMMYILHDTAMMDGSYDPAYYVVAVREGAIGALMIGGFALVALMLSAWAWLLPRSKPDRVSR